MPGTFAVDAREVGQVGVLTTEGYINNLGADKIVDVCSSLQEQGVDRFLINLEKSRLVNSIGISILIELIENVIGGDGRIGFCCATPTIEKTFKIMGLLQRAQEYGTEDDGLADLSDN